MEIQEPADSSGMVFTSVETTDEAFDYSGLTDKGLARILLANEDAVSTEEWLAAFKYAQSTVKTLAEQRSKLRAEILDSDPDYAKAKAELVMIRKRVIGKYPAYRKVQATALERKKVVAAWIQTAKLLRDDLDGLNVDDLSSLADDDAE